MRNNIMVNEIRDNISEYLANYLNANSICKYDDVNNEIEEEREWTREIQKRVVLGIIEDYL